MVFEKKKFEENIFRAPDIIFTYKIGFENDLCCALLSSYIYNMVMQGKKTSRPDFFTFLSNMEKSLNSDLDPEGLVSQIIDTCIERTVPVYTASNWCLEFINQYIDPYERVNLKNISNKISQGRNQDQLCRYFSEKFKVEVDLIFEDDNKLYTIRTPGRYMKIRILCTKNLFRIPFNKEMDELDNEKTGNEKCKEILNSKFNSEPFLVERSDSTTNLNIEIDQRLCYSNRFPCEYLEINDSLKSELSLEFASAVKIMDNSNQVFAFSYHLANYLALNNRGEYLQAIRDYFSKSQTLSGMVLSGPIGFEDISFISIANICNNLIVQCFQNPGHFSEIEPLTFNNSLEQSFSVLRILCKIFAVNLIIISDEGQSVQRFRFTSDIAEFGIDFHFLSIKVNIMYRVLVLNTHRQHFLEDFDFRDQSKHIKIPQVQDFLYFKQKVDNVADHLKRNEELEQVTAKIISDTEDLNQQINFYKSMIQVQNSVLANIADCISKNTPLSVPENLETQINNLKGSLETLNKKVQLGPELNQSEVFQYKTKLTQICKLCNKNFPQGSKLYFSTNGTCLHFECMDNLVLTWYDQTNNINCKLEDITIPCPNINENFPIISFLKLPEKADHYKKIKCSFEKKVTCCSCSNDIPISDQMIQTGNIDYLHCQTCMVKLMYSAGCQNCQITINHFLSQGPYLLTCDCCKTTTHIQNFRYSMTRNETKCKKCWVSEFIQSLNMNQQVAYDIQSTLTDLNLLINCQSCNNNAYRSIPGKICPNGCSNVVCINCAGGDLCSLCGSELLDDTNIWP